MHFRGTALHLLTMKGVPPVVLAGRSPGRRLPCTVPAEEGAPVIYDELPGGTCCIKPRVAIVDEFKVPTVDINMDGEKDLPHGRVVETVLSSMIDAEIERFTNDNPVKVLTAFIPEQLAKIAERGDFDGVNISAGMHKSLRILARKTGISDLCPQNVDRYREAIRNYYMETGEEEVHRVLEAIEKLTASGVRVYVAAGNKGLATSISSGLPGARSMSVPSPWRTSPSSPVHGTPCSGTTRVSLVSPRWLIRAGT